MAIALLLCMQQSRGATTTSMAVTTAVNNTCSVNAAPVPLTVYALLPDSAANQAAVPGTYSDTILIVIVY